MSDVFKKMAEERKKEDARYDLMEQHAQKAGLVLVKVSARRYTVVKLDGAGRGCWLNDHPVRGYYTSLNGTVVFGPDTHERCHNYIAETSGPIPPEANP
jgi:hypothetical protein